MKQIIIFTFMLFSAIAVQAQTPTAKALERVGFVRDSVQEVLNEHRTNYARREDMRERLAPMIASLEREVVRLQAEYDNVVESLSQQDIKSALTAYKEAQQSVGNSGKDVHKSEPKNEVYIPDAERVKRDLVTNDYFVERLSSSDYAQLRESQQRESSVKIMVSNYLTGYSQLLALQREYMEVATREKADSIALLFAAKGAELKQLDGEISSAWSSLYFNKMYSYDLLMERAGNSAMLDCSANATAQADREINENSGIYQSEALVGYYTRKKALVDYEMQLASSLSLTKSRDSLKMVQTDLKNCDYRLSKLSLERRSFILYEEIDVKIPSVYNSKNPVPLTKVYDYGTIYRIRIGLFSKRPNVSALRGVMPLSYTNAYNKGLYAYFVGGFRTEQEAKEGVAYLKKIGFRDPIVAVWVDGEYYPTVEEMRRSESQYNIEISGVPTLTEDIKAKIIAHKSDCAISRVGSTFIVGTFEGKSAAEAVAADIRSVNSDIVVEVTKKP